jgi:hypothetical protein
MRRARKLDESKCKSATAIVELTNKVETVSNAKCKADKNKALRL